MKKLFSPLPESISPQARTASRIALIMLATILPTALFYFFLAYFIDAWQMVVAAGAVTVYAVITIMAYFQARRGWHEWAAHALILGLAGGFLTFNFVIEDFGLVLGAVVILVAVNISGPTLSQRSAQRVLAITILAGLLMVVFDLFSPDYRLQVPQLKTYIPVVLSLLVLAFAFIFARQYRKYSLRVKMIIAFIVVVVISVGVVAFITTRGVRASLTENIGINLATLAETKAIEIGQSLDREVDVMKTLALNEAIEDVLTSVSETEMLSPLEIEQFDAQWQAADAANDDSDVLVTSVIENSLATKLRQFQEEFPQHVEVFVTDQQGLSIASTNRTSDYYQADETWWQAAYEEGLYIGQPEFDQSSKSLAIIMATAIQDNRSGKVLGILRTTVDFSILSESLVAGRFGQTGHTNIYFPNGTVLTLNAQESGLYELQLEDAELDINLLARSPKRYQEITYKGVPILASQANMTVLGNIQESGSMISDLNWHIVVKQDQAEALQPIETQMRNILLLTFAISILAGFAAIGLAQIISGPIVRLNAIAEKIASGNLSVQAEVETADETGALAASFNKMTTQLRGLIESLELRVAERTKALATSTEVSRRLSTILDQQILLTEVVEQVKSAFEYYHAHIYLLDEKTGDAVMAGGTGEAGQTMLSRSHRLSKGKGLVGRAAETNRPVLIPDTAKEPDWLPNSLLPDTRSELAVPISIGEQVIGVLDVQHNIVGGLKQDDVDLLQSIASQVAIALKNAQAYKEAQRRAEREALISAINQQIQSTSQVEEALKVTVREIGRVLGTKTIVKLGPKNSGNGSGIKETQDEK